MTERVAQAADMLEPIILDNGFLSVRSALAAIGYVGASLSFVIRVTGELRQRAVAKTVVNEASVGSLQALGAPAPVVISHTTQCSVERHADRDDPGPDDCDRDGNRATDAAVSQRPSA